MRLLTYLFLVVGSSFLLLNFTAFWEPYDYHWPTAMIGLGMVIIGAILKAGLNLYDEEQNK